MLRGLKRIEMPLFGGKELTIMTAFLTSSLTMSFGDANFHGIALMAARTCSFNVRIKRSTSPTCSFAAVGFNVILNRSSRIGFTYVTSLRTQSIINPLLLYDFLTDFKHSTHNSMLVLFTFSTVQNLIFRDTVTKNSSPFT